MEPVVQMLLTIFGAVMASSGFWAFMTKRCDTNGLQTTMLIGLAHDRITYLGMCYIERGWITHDEYENLDKYLFAPYQKLGGNGSASRIMAEVSKLPIRNVSMLLNMERSEV